MPTPSLDPTLTIARPQLSCLRDDDDSAARIAVAGELDLATAAQLDIALRRAQLDATLVILDLHELEFIDSSGMDLLLTAQRRIGRGGGRLVVHARAEVAWFLALVGVTGRLEPVDAPPAVPAAGTVGVAEGARPQVFPQ